MRKLTIFLFCLASPLLTMADSTNLRPVDHNLHPKVVLDTNLGKIVLTLDARRAPISVQNFLRYVEDGHYDNTIFHRVIDGFVAQGGGFTADMTEKTTREPIPNEAGNGLSNTKGTLAMARTQHPHSGTAQFYINLADNTALDPSAQRWGYCVFGEVTAGWDVIEKIAKVETGPRKMMPRDVPKKDIVIKKAYRFTKLAKPTTDIE